MSECTEYGQFAHRLALATPSDERMRRIRPVRSSPRGWSTPR